MAPGIKSLPISATSPAPDPQALTHRVPRGRWRVDWSSVLTGLPAAFVVWVCCGLPLLWMAGALLLASPEVRQEMRITSFRAELLARTLGYNGLAAVLATLMGIPAGFVLGRGRGPVARALWVIIPAALLMPSLSYAYGWKEVAFLSRNWLRDHFVITFVPGGAADTLRCIWSLAAWLWAVPAGLIALALRRMDTSVQQQALLDGALRRVTLRQLLPAILVSLAVVTILATQEFAVYEPTGISVVATEVRMVFDTGAVSNATNPIAGPVIQGTGARSPDQPARAAAAVATALPMVVVTFLIAFLVARYAQRANVTDTIAVGPWPRVLDVSPWTVGLTLLLLALNVGVPVGALLKSLKAHRPAGDVWAEFSPQVIGAMVVAFMTAVLAAVAAFSAAGRWTRGLLLLAGTSFLIGGQILAIADIRIYNRPGLFWAYEAFPVPVFAYFGRFGWLALAAGRSTWSPPWRELRDMACVDGASTARIGASIVWPLAWPALLAGGMLVGALSLTEVPATVLITPENPQVLTPLLMTWVHQVRYDPMIEASLLMMAVVLGPALLAVMLTGIAFRLASRFGSHPRS